MSTSRFSASRTADVATAVIGRVVHLGHLAEPVEGGHGPVDGVVARARACRPALEPRRTISFSRSRISKRGPPSPAVIRATTPWTELVPMSTAASVSVGGSEDGAIAPSLVENREWCRVVSLAMPPSRRRSAR